MANMLAAGQAFLTRMLKEAICGAEITYKRGSLSVTFTAALGRSQLEVQDLEGSTQLKWTDADFLIAPEDLVLGGEETEPRRGDQILRTVGSKVYTFDVGSLPGLDAWTWSDPQRTRMRVRTKQVKVEDA